MALQKDFVTDSGIELVNAYFKINTFSGDREQIHFTVGAYKDEQARLDGLPAAGVLEYIAPTPNGTDNLFKDLYVHLKTLVEFDDAQDI